MQHIDESMIPKPIRQRGSHDCGVACLAMGACMDYEGAKDVFDRMGLNLKPRGHRKPYSSNFKELRNAFQSVGYSTRMERFIDWSLISSPSVVKVRNGKKFDWHWVYADRSEQFGLYVLNPAIDEPFFEKMPMDVMCVALEHYKPFGCFIKLTQDSSSATI